MGLNMEPTDQPGLQARPGPGAIVPKLVTVLGAGLAAVGRLVASAPASPPHGPVAAQSQLRSLWKAVRRPRR